MPAMTIGVIHTGSRKSLKGVLVALRRDHDLADAELVVVGVDAGKKPRKWIKKQPGVRYLRVTNEQSPSALDTLFAAATGDVVLCLEGAVRLQSGSLARIRDYFQAHPDARDVLHGPLMKRKRVIATHADPVWQEAMWGARACDERGMLAGGDPFVIAMHEPGVFCCRRDAWPGMPPGWRGYGAEAGYFQEQVRRKGGQVLCFPGLRWEQRSSPEAIPPRSAQAERYLRNHLVGAAFLSFDTQCIALRFRDIVEGGRADLVRTEVLRALETDRSPLPPLVSCLLYAGRITPSSLPLVEEAIESFLRQDYVLKELIVFNDTPEQVLTCDAPGVRVINASQRCSSLGDAFNAAVAFARGDLLAPWGASSINLPWRLSSSVAQLGTRQVFRPESCWYMLDGELDARPARPDGGQVALFTREAFRAVGGYSSVTLRVHHEMDAALDARYPVEDMVGLAPTLPRSGWFTILRRVQRDAQYHGDSTLDPWQAMGHLPAMTGRITLRPRWKQDYVALCQDFMPSDERVDTAHWPVPRAFVLGRKRGNKDHWLPRLDPEPGEPPQEHLDRVSALLIAAIAAGASHLVVPRTEADWLSFCPRVAEYLADQHLLVRADAEIGFVFALNDTVLTRPRERAATVHA